MPTLEELEKFYEEVSLHPLQYFPEGISEIDIKVLFSLHLLSETLPPSPFTHFLRVLETKEKIILYNNDFVIFIAPQKEPFSSTVLIAKIEENILRPELAFRASGIHNQSKEILRIIEHYLTDIQETDSFIDSLRTV